MSSLDQAINRLQQSVDRLEVSISVSASKNSESDGMQAQVKQLQAQCDRLLEVTKQVDEGLDKTIDRLKLVFGGLIIVAQVEVTVNNQNFFNSL
ncbi:MAG: hypothetical protein ACJZ2G_07915 [Thalassobaculaceae bacterium]